MSDTIQAAERIATLETKIEHLEKEITELKNMVREMRDAFIGVKGAKATIFIIGAVAAFFLTKLIALIPFIR